MSDKNESFGARMARLNAERQAEAERAPAQQAQAQQELREQRTLEEISSCRQFISSIAEKHEAIISAIFEKPAKVGLPKRTFCLFAFIRGDHKLIYDEIRPLLGAIDTSGLEPILFHSNSSGMIFDATPLIRGTAQSMRGIGSLTRTKDGLRTWQNFTEKGGYMIVQPTSDLGRVIPEESGWMEAQTFDQNANTFRFSFGNDLVAIGARTIT